MTVTAGPLVTVIVPGFDVESFAAEALDSLQAQTLTQWRAVLVNDASRDGTGRIFDAYAQRDDRFTVVHLPHRGGLGAARNHGLQLVDTEYVMFLDADDVMRPRALEALAATLAESGSDFAVGAYVRLRPDSAGGYTPGDVQPWVVRATSPRRLRLTVEDHPAVSGNIVAWSKMSRAELWRGRDRLLFPEGKAYEDQVVAQQMYTTARAFDVIPDVLIEWRERADGTSITQHKGELSVLRDYLEALDAGLEVLRAAGAETAIHERLPLILTLDVPPLVALGEHHADPSYRSAIGAFVRSLEGRGNGVAVPLAPDAASALSLARTW